MKQTDQFDDAFFEQLSSSVDLAAPSLSARLKSRVYSALMHTLSADAPLRTLSECQQEGHRLCVFEKSLTLVRIAGSRVAQRIESFNPCSVCHARLLGENMDHPPVTWRGCPYGDFQQY